MLALMTVTIKCNFNALIADCIGFDDHPDENFSRFDEILDKYSEEIEPNNESLMKQVMNVYVELVLEKKKQQGTSNPD